MPKLPRTAITAAAIHPIMACYFSADSAARKRSMQDLRLSMYVLVPAPAAPRPAAKRLQK